MWLRSGDGSLGEVEAFITGFQHGKRMEADPHWFDCFTRWVAARYEVRDGPRNGFTLIREHVGGDEPSAFGEFFRLLPDYIHDIQEIGPEGISTRYRDVMARIRTDA